MQCFNNFIQSMLHNFKFASQYSLQNTPCSIEIFTHRAPRMQRERRQPVFENVHVPHQMNISPPHVLSLGHKLNLKKNTCWHI